MNIERIKTLRECLSIIIQEADNLIININTGNINVTVNYLDQIYMIDTKDVLINYNPSESEIRRIITEIRDIKDISDYLNKSKKLSKPLELCCKNFEKIEKYISQFSVDALEGRRISEEIAKYVLKITSDIVENILERCITHINASKELNKDVYRNIVFLIKEYFERIGVYNFRCPVGADYSDENINCYFSAQSSKTITSDESLYGIINSVIYPAHIIRYYDYYENEETFIVEGKCNYFCEG